MKNPAFEQPVQTNSRPLLFRYRRRLMPCRRGSSSGLASYGIAMQIWRGSRGFYRCVALPRRPNLSVWLGMFEKVQMIS